MVAGWSDGEKDARERVYRTDGSPRGQGQEENQRCELEHLASLKKREKGKKTGSLVHLRREDDAWRNQRNGRCISSVREESQFHSAAGLQQELLVSKGWPEVCLLMSFFRHLPRENST